MFFSFVKIFIAKQEYLSSSIAYCWFFADEK